MMVPHDGAGVVGGVDIVVVPDFLTTRVESVWCAPQICTPRNTLPWMAEEGRVQLMEIRNLREESKQLLTVIIHCLNGNARLRPLRQCLLTLPYLRMASGQSFPSEVWQRIAHFASGLSNMARAPRMVNVAVPRMLMCANAVTVCNCPPCEALSRQRVFAECQALLRREMALDVKLFSAFKQAMAVNKSRCVDVFSLIRRSRVECDQLLCVVNLNVVTSLCIDS